MTDKLKKCLACNGRGYFRCDCWPGDCICGQHEETCWECEGDGWIDPSFDDFDPTAPPQTNLRVVWTCHNNLANGYFGGAVANDENGVVWDFAQQTWVNADIPLYAGPPPRTKEVGDDDRESAMKDGYAQALATYQPTKLIAAIRAAEEEFNRISCEGVTETRSVSDALDRAKAFADRGAIACRAALASEG